MRLLRRDWNPGLVELGVLVALVVPEVLVGLAERAERAEQVVRLERLVQLEQRAKLAPVERRVRLTAGRPQVIYSPLPFASPQV